MDSFQRVLLCFVLAALTQPVLAATFYVGTCKAGGLTSISAAVAAVPAGSTVNVCPGTYAEQVQIDKSLTLQGITSGNSSNVVITIPAGGLTQTTSVLFGSSVSPQVWVTGALEAGVLATAGWPESFTRAARQARSIRSRCATKLVAVAAWELTPKTDPAPWRQ
jgi:pectin methylesterase-like acyl-CoA thioesterase